MMMRWPLERELCSIASRSGCPKVQRWLEEGFSTFLKDDLIINSFFYITERLLTFRSKFNGYEIRNSPISIAMRWVL